MIKRKVISLLYKIFGGVTLKIHLKPKFLLLVVAFLPCLILIASCNTPSVEKQSINSHLVIDLLGTKHETLVDSQGKLKNSVQLASANAIVSLSIDKDTRFLNKDKERLQQIHIVASSSLPLPPENAQIIGNVYELVPAGATAVPLLRVMLSYDPKELPKGVNESDVYIAPYDEGAGWGKWSYKRIDTENHKVTTQFSQFSKFTVLAPLAPTPPQPTPKPTSGVDLASKSLVQALSSGKPTLAEFGRGTCIPCKAMKPILEELSIEYKDKLNVVIISIDEYKDLTSKYKIMAIPTQIFFDSTGKEVTRHVGFWPKAEILTQLKKMGIE